MDTTSIQERLRRFTLTRVDENGTTEEVGTFASFEEGWSQGQHMVHTEPQAAFSLYMGKRRVARFCHHRLQQRDVTANLDAMVGLS